MRARASVRGTSARGSAGAGRRQYVDDMMDEYVSWRHACAAVAVAYESWTCSGRTENKVPFSAYVAALDREEQSAVAYQRAVELVATA